MIFIITRNHNNYLDNTAYILNKIFKNSIIYSSSIIENSKISINLFVDDILEDTYNEISKKAKLNVLLINCNYYKNKYLVRYNYKNIKLLKIKNCVNYVVNSYDFLNNYLTRYYKVCKIPNLILLDKKEKSITNENILLLNIDEYNYYKNYLIVDVWIKNNYFLEIHPKPKLIIFTNSYKTIISKLINNIKSHKNIEIIYKNTEKIKYYNCSIITSNKYNISNVINTNITNKKYIIVIKNNISKMILNKNCIYINEKNIKKSLLTYFNLNLNTKINHILDNYKPIDNLQLQTIF
jgi:hypothetical protein